MRHCLKLPLPTRLLRVSALNDLIPLSQLTPGQTGLIGELVGEPHEVHRLEELGLRSGVPVQMVSPGTPCIVRIGGTKLCFRDCELFQVLVIAGAVA